MLNNNEMLKVKCRLVGKSESPSDSEHYFLQLAGLAILNNGPLEETLATSIRNYFWLAFTGGLVAFCLIDGGLVFLAKA